MEPFSKQLIADIDAMIEKKHLLKHPFYQAWSRGELSVACLKEYAKEYYHHVKAFPGYLSAAHSHAESQDVQKILLENLVEEQGGSPNHPDLWRHFAASLGVTEDELKSHTPSSTMAEMIDTFRTICHKKSTPEAVAALYAYESQIPAICVSKIDGLKNHYGLDKEGWKYFSVHIAADEVHAEQERTLLSSTAEKKDREAILESVDNVLTHLNGFLTSLCHKFNICTAMCS